MNGFNPFNNRYVNNDCCGNNNQNNSGYPADPVMDFEYVQSEQNV